MTERAFPQPHGSYAETKTHYLNLRLVHFTKPQNSLSFVNSFSFILWVKYSIHLLKMYITCHWVEEKEG